MRTLLTAALLVGALGCGAPEPPPQIVLVVCDTLRADHLTVYGYERPTSPVLERLAAEATVYTRFQASAPWTLPSHASMFTGLEPAEHGARTLSAEELIELQEQGWQGQNNAAPLAARHTTLAEHFREKGWATAAIVANTAYLDPRFGVAQGFEHYDRRRGDVTDMTTRALAWIDAHREEPFFLVLNLMDTHRPYNTRPRADLPDRSGEGNLLKRLVPLVMDPAREAPPELLDALRDQYDTAIGNLEPGRGPWAPVRGPARAARLGCPDARGDQRPRGVPRRARPDRALQGCVPGDPRYSTAREGSRPAPR